MTPLNINLCEVIMNVIVFLFICAATVKGLQQQTTEIDLVLQALKSQQWSQEEMSCFDQTVFTLNNAKNYTVWAMWIWNSMQYPMGIFYGSPFSLGHYDQCLQAPTKAIHVNTQYCLADVKLTDKIHPWERRSAMGDSESYLGTINEMKRDVSKVLWGVCLPATCKPESAVKILKSIYNVNPLMPGEPTVEIEYCEVAGVKTAFSTGFYAFMLLILALVSTAVISTVYVHISNKISTTMSIAQCFCLRRNWISLVKTTDDDITIINALKVVFATSAVTIHSCIFRISGPIANIFYLDRLLLLKDTDIFLKNVTKNFHLPLDVFFLMSGILLIKGLMVSKKPPLVSLASRYFRLMGPYALVTFYVAGVSIYTGDGPLWRKLAGREQKASSDNWLWCFLMLNNIVNSENITQIVAWHVPCDYQLAIMGTIIFMSWRQSYRLGKIVTILTSVLAILLPAFVSYWKKLPGNLFFHDFGKIKDVRTNEFYHAMYIKSYYRAICYLQGMGLGYIVAMYKPEMHRKCISLKASLLLVAASLVVSLIAIFADQCKIDDYLSVAARISYEKVFFGLAICVCIGVVEYGSIPYVRMVTGFHGFTVLSRLTYGIYMTHSLFLQQNAFSRRYIQDFEWYFEITYGIGVVCLSVVAAVALWLLVEAPINNLINYITMPRVSQNKLKEDNVSIFKKPEDNYKFDKMVKSEQHYIEKLKQI